jgi:hypothetical protein
VLARITAAIFFVAFTMQTFSGAVVTAWFYINQKHIAATLCENRDRPSLKCCGKCQLRKALSQKNKQQNEPLLKLGSKTQLFCNGYTVEVSVLYFAMNAICELPYFNALSWPCYDIFKPPC